MFYLVTQLNKIFFTAVLYIYVYTLFDTNHLYNFDVITYLSNSIYITEQGWKMTIVYTVREIRNNIKIYTEQGWKMVIVYTVKEIRNINKGCIK
jgi:hypothetical protein